MFRENNSHRQTNLFDSINFMHTRVAEKLINTWAHIFYHNVFCKIDEKPFAVLYSDIGRPNFPINILLSLEYIKHLFDYTDEGLVENFYFNFLVSYAVGINVLGELNLAERTLYYFRERVYIYTLQHPDEDDLIFGQFINLTKSFTEIMGISTEEQRMDSSFITSNIKKAGRLALAFDVLEQAVKTLPEELLTESLKQVLKPDFKNTVLYRIKANETTSKLEYIISLCSQMAEIVSNNPDLKSFNEIKILSRFLSEQTEYDVESKVLKPKANDKITADSLQSAYDEDATYRTKGNKSESGYVINMLRLAVSLMKFS